MRIGLTILLILLVTHVLDAGQPATLGKLLSKRLAEISAGEECLVLVSFKDKGSGRHVQSGEVRELVSEKSLQRRRKVRSADALLDDADLPLDRAYVAEVGRRVTTLRNELKWFNAISAVATRDQIETLRALPFVAKIELVGKWRRKQEELEAPVSTKSVLAPQGTASLDYGASYTQLNQINVPALHDLGIYGQGVTICVLDNGFRLLSHEAFASMNIIAQHDFVDHKTSVIPNNPAGGFGAHGVNTLSAIGGYKPGQLIGPAFKSSFILARTENDSSETPFEEDNWAKAVEWADSIGVDVTSTSLGYLTYDSPYTSWTWEDMDGATTLITQAADHAASLGIVVVNSAGNDAQARSGDPNTLIAPADGFDVITVGAVMSNGIRAAFSSFGPTFDGRIKPDVMAMGSNVRLASSSITNGYVNGSGTSFSCPLTAGVAALLLCANPALDPAGIADALRQTASNATSPDDYYGWGIVNALDALHYNEILPIAKVRGTAYIDVNGDGNIGGGDAPASGVKITLGGTMAETTLTDGSGNFTFSNLAIGNYTLRQSLLPGSIQTLPESLYSFTLLHGVDTSGFRFAGFRLGTLHGTVFEDLDLDGVLDSGEAGVPSWRVRLFGPDTVSTSTDINGHFTLSNIRSGTYTLSESTMAGWTQTYPLLNGSYTVVISSGTDSAGLNFGNSFDPNSNYHVIDNWNLLALPKNVADHATKALYPTATTGAFVYAGNYQSADTLRNGRGYWLKFHHAQNVHILGDEIVSDTVAVKKGWNIIGGLSHPTSVSSIVQSPPGIVISNYYLYTGSYQIADSLRPHFGYWVKMNADGNIALASSSIAVTLPPAPESSPGSIAKSYAIFTFVDAHGMMQSLNVDAGDATAAIRSELPPLPPEGGFDVRFSNQQWSTSLSPGKSAVVNITGASYPMKIRYETHTEGMQLILDGRKLSLSGSSEFMLPGAVRSISLQMDERLQSKVIPRETSLGSNYPNPFNPTTEISFAVGSASNDAMVTLDVFDVLGRNIASLVHERKGAGTYSVVWDAGVFPSGTYFYRLTVGAFSDIRKMLLLR